MYRSLILLLTIPLCSAPAAAETIEFTPTEGTFTYAVREPVLRVRPGDILETNTLFSDFFTEKDGPWPGEVGPIYVEGATDYFPFPPGG